MFRWPQHFHEPKQCTFLTLISIFQLRLILTSVYLFFEHRYVFYVLKTCCVLFGYTGCGGTH